MNWKTENLKSFNFYQPTSKEYRENFNKAQNNTEEKPIKQFRVTYCKRCNIKVSTWNDKCPCCEEPVE